MLNTNIREFQVHRTNLPLSLVANGRFAGMRTAAFSARDQAEKVLLRGEEVTFDFFNIAVTQSFIDELSGTLILRYGPDILQRIIFKNCSDDTRAIIEFVVADRCDQYIKQRSVS